MAFQTDKNLESYYLRKKILVTGGLGFLGSSLALSLSNYGAEVTVMDNLAPGYGGNIFNIDPIRDFIDISLSDIRDESAVRDLIQGKDMMFHLAGQVCHVMSMENPFPDIDINIKGTAILAETCRRVNPQIKIVFTGTRGQYGPSTKLPVCEDAPTNPKGIYEISNLTAEKILRVYNDIHGVRSVMLRLTNIYGPRAQMKHARFGVVNWFVRLALDEIPIPIFGDGKILRDFVYVDDCVRALLLCGAAKCAEGEIVNVGHDRPQNFLEVAETLKKILPETEWEFTPFTPERKAQEPGDFYSDINKIGKICGWSPTTTLREGLEKTVNYYRLNQPKYW
tara:strand:+ start:429 stop:1439 length:1011 start_codon:yes stop_codon:yes gene_type:complete